MGQLRCELSPVVFAELYGLLASDSSLRALLEERLDEIGYDLDWLEARAVDYRAKWSSDLASALPETLGDLAMPPNQAEFATWILAGLRYSGSSYELSSALAGAVRTTVASDAPHLSAQHPSLSPVIRGWTLGAVWGSLDPALPMVLAQTPSDAHVADAYEGLVEQVLHLSGLEQPWPEMGGTAVFVRAGGLAEALRPTPTSQPRRSLQNSINLLMNEAQSQAPSFVMQRLRQNWADFVAKRNVLTHVSAEDPSMTFSDTASQVRTWYEIESAVLGITQFVCQQVSEELFDYVPHPLRSDPWDSYMKYSVITDW